MKPKAIMIEIKIENIPNTNVKTALLFTFGLSITLSFAVNSIHTLFSNLLFNNPALFWHNLQIQGEHLISFFTTKSVPKMLKMSVILVPGKLPIT